MRIAFDYFPFGFYFFGLLACGKSCCKRARARSASDEIYFVYYLRSNCTHDCLTLESTFNLANVNIYTDLFARISSHDRTCGDLMSFPDIFALFSFGLL